MSNFIIKSIVPCPMPMQAVYYDPIDEEVVRQDVVCLAVIQNYDSEGDEWDYVRPMVCDKGSGFSDPSWDDGFLGVENGKELDWDDEVKELLKKMNNKPKLVS